MNDQALEPAVIPDGTARLTSRLRSPMASAVSGTPALVSAALGAVVLLATSASAGPVGPASTGETSTQAQTVAVFSGTYVDGVPVYRLPRITVFAARPTELAKNERKGQPARSRDAQSKAAAKPV